MSNLVKKTEGLPELPRQEQIYARASQIMRRQYPPEPNGWGEFNSAATYLAALDAILPEAQAVLNDLQQLGRPASMLEIGKQLAILVKCYPNAGSADGEIYGRMLIEDVAAMQPSIGDIDAACRHLRRTSKFTPAISEVLEAIAEAKHHRHDITGKILDITTSRDRRVMEVEKEREQHEAHLAHQRTCWKYGDIIDPTQPPL